MNLTKFHEIFQCCALRCLPYCYYGDLIVTINNYIMWSIAMYAMVSPQSFVILKAHKLLQYMIIEFKSHYIYQAYSIFVDRF